MNISIGYEAELGGEFRAVEGLSFLTCKSLFLTPLDEVAEVGVCRASLPLLGFLRVEFSFPVSTCVEELVVLAAALP